MRVFDNDFKRLRESIYGEPIEGSAVEDNASSCELTYKIERGSSRFFCNIQLNFRVGKLVGGIVTHRQIIIFELRLYNAWGNKNIIYPEEKFALKNYRPAHGGNHETGRK